MARPSLIRRIWARTPRKVQSVVRSVISHSWKASRSGSNDVSLPTQLSASDDVQRPTPKKSEVEQLAEFPLGSVQVPELTIVMPTFNVAEYVEEAARSVLAQEGVALELIIVDDGSSDDTVRKIIKLKSDDGRVRFVRSEHAGNGRARNLGMEAARGEFLGFCDADDIVPPGSYSFLVSRLRETGSDFISGAYQRLDNGKTFIPKSVRESNPGDLDNATVQQIPEAMLNPFLWSKIFRRTFWDAAVGSLPEGRNYEDQLPTALAYCEATSFDITSKIIYTWRIRPGGSLTQRKHTDEDLLDRTYFIDQLAGVYQSQGNGVFQFWLAKIVRDDLYYFLLALPKASDEFASELVRSYRMILSNITDQTFDTLPFWNRAVLEVCERSTEPRKDLETLLVTRERYGDRGYEIDKGDEGYIVHPPFLSPLTFELERSIRVQSPDIILEPVVVDICFGTDASVSALVDLGLRGHEAVDARSVEVALVSGSSALTVGFAVAEAPLANLVSNDPLSDHSKQAICLSLTEELLSSLVPGAEYTVCVRYDLDGVEMESEVGSSSSAGLPTFGSLSTSGHRWILAAKEGRVVVRSERSFAGLSVYSSGSGSLTLTVDSFRDPVAELVVEPEGGAARKLSANAPQVVPVGSRFEVLGLELPTSLPIKSQARWSLFAVDDSGRKTRLSVQSCARDLYADPHSWGTLRIEASGWGYASVAQSRWTCVLTEAKLSEDSSRLVLSGVADLLEPPSPRIVLVDSNGSTIEPVFVRRGGTNADHWTAEFDLSPSTMGIHVGRFTLRWAASWHQKVTDAYYVDFGMKVGGPSDELVARDFRVAIDRTSTGVTAVRLMAPLRVDERGPFSQRRLQQVFSDSSVPLDEGAVFLECFNAKSFGDNVAPVAQALHDLRPDLKLFVSASSDVRSLPDYVTRVVPYSSPWYHAMATSKYVVTNNNLPQFFKKREGQRYVQLWHGTPLKRLLFDMSRESRMLNYWSLMVDEVPQWDGLLAQNEFAADRFRTAFGYEGDIQVLGYPRNDLLVNEKSLAPELREKLSLKPEDFVILYAPTWRDNLRGPDGRVYNGDFLDLETLQRQLPDNARVLFRSHHVASGTPRELPSAVVDVTEYPDVSELYLMADLLITDYSSVMFDFPVTGKPMVFLAPDVDDYAGDNRGMYLDYEDTVPGPVVKSTEELIDVLTQWPETGAPVVDARYSEWVKRFCGNDDGDAALRVAEWILDS